jgi:hypothetical protein
MGLPCLPFVHPVMRYWTVSQRFGIPLRPPDTARQNFGGHLCKASVAAQWHHDRARLVAWGTFFSP